MKKKSIAILAVVIIIVIGYNYIYKDHRNIEKENADFVVTSFSLFEEFSLDQKQAETNYLDKTIEISGLVTELNSNDLTLDEKIYCKLLTPLSGIKLNDQIKIKGRCIGFDDLLEQVKVDQCNIINK